MSTNTLDTDRLSRILAAVAGGATYTEIAAQEGISRQRACQIVQEHSGASPLAGRAVRIARMLELGLTREQIARVEDCSEEWIADTFRDATGVALRSEEQIREDAERQLLRRLYEGGMSAYALAKALRMQPSGITMRITRAGGVMRPSTREKREVEG